MPLARALVRRGDGEAWLERLEAALDAPGPQLCAFYQPDPTNSDRGRCAVYEHRPSVCRLFGYAAVRDKAGRPDLSVCRVMREASPDSMAAAANAVRDGEAAAPIVADEFRALHAAVVGPKQLPQPINVAAREALREELFKAHLRAAAAAAGDDDDSASSSNS